MNGAARRSSSVDEFRKQNLFEAAVGVFARYGFRKTSMEEVATAAGLSRQGLYLHFATKEDLFRAMVNHVLATSFRAVEKVLLQEELTLDVRLLRAFDQWLGKYVGMLAADASDLVKAAQCLVGDVVTEYEQRFSEITAAAMVDSPLAKAYGRSGIRVEQLVSTLVATARGLKTHCATRADFCAEFQSALRVMFAKEH